MAVEIHTPIRNKREQQPISGIALKGSPSLTLQDYTFNIPAVDDDKSVFIIGAGFYEILRIYRSIQITNTAITGGTSYSLDLYHYTSPTDVELLEDDLFNAGVIDMSTARLGNTSLELVDNTTIHSTRDCIADFYQKASPATRSYSDLARFHLVLGLTANTIGTVDGTINIRASFWNQRT